MNVSFCEELVLAVGDITLHLNIIFHLAAAGSKSSPQIRNGFLNIGVEFGFQHPQGYPLNCLERFYILLYRLGILCHLSGIDLVSDGFVSKLQPLFGLLLVLLEIQSSHTDCRNRL